MPRVFWVKDMTQAKFSALRSVDLGFTDLGKAVKFFSNVWNLSGVGENAGVHFFRATGPFHHVLSIRQTPQPSMIRMVFDAVDAATVDALHEQVKAHGLTTIDPPAKLRQPHGEYGFGFKDPEGRNIASVCGVKDHTDGADGADRPRKVSHVNINAGDSDATLACYRDALGFKVSDTTRKFHFMTCNADHHNIVLGYGRRADAQSHRL